MDFTTAEAIQRDAPRSRKDVPLTMIYDPPPRVTVSDPRTERSSIITGSGGPSMYSPHPFTFSPITHQIERPVTMQSRVAMFTTNVAERDCLVRRTGAGHQPLPPLPAATASSAPPPPGDGITLSAVPTPAAMPGVYGGLVRASTTTSAAISDPSFARRSWVEPHPRSAQRLARDRFLLADLSDSFITHMLLYLTPDELDSIAVFVCRRWHACIMGDVRLRARRMAFVWSRERDYDYRGILFYIANRWRGDPPAAIQEIITNHHTVPSYYRFLRRPTGPEPYADIANPSTGIPAVAVQCSRLLKGPRGREKAEQGHLTNFTSPGLSCFVSENMPFSWVGVDMMQFRVAPTAYTIGTAAPVPADGPTSAAPGEKLAPGGGGDDSAVLQLLKAAPCHTPPFPLSWELQGCRARDCYGDLHSSEDWADQCRWHVLDRRSYPPGAPLFSLSRRSATFDIDPAAIRRWGYFKRFRIVQTARNATWGHELCVSGFEIYGSLVLDRRPSH